MIASGSDSVCISCCFCLLTLSFSLFFLSFVAPFVDFSLGDVQKLSKRELLLVRPDWVLLELGLKDAGLYLPKAITVLYDALFAAEVNNDPLLCLGFLGLCL